MDEDDLLGNSDGDGDAHPAEEGEHGSQTEAGQQQAAGSAASSAASAASRKGRPKGKAKGKAGPPVKKENLKMIECKVCNDQVAYNKYLMCGEPKKCKRASARP